MLYLTQSLVHIGKHELANTIGSGLWAKVNNTRGSDADGLFGSEEVQSVSSSALQFGTSNDTEDYTVTV